jgi:hypothetical protein
MREAVPPGGQVTDATGVAVGVTRGVALGGTLGGGVPVGVIVTRTDGVGVATTAAADGDREVDGDAAAMREEDAGAAPPNGGKPSRAELRITSERMTRTTPAMVQSGTPPARFSWASS